MRNKEEYYSCEYQIGDHVKDIEGSFSITFDEYADICEDIKERQDFSLLESIIDYKPDTSITLYIYFKLYPYYGDIISSNEVSEFEYLIHEDEKRIECNSDIV